MAGRVGTVSVFAGADHHQRGHLQSASVARFGRRKAGLFGDRRDHPQARAAKDRGRDPRRWYDIAFVADGGCPIENAMEDARFGNPFPSEDIVRIIEDGKTKYWNVCKSFETDDADIMKSFQALFDDHPTDKHDVTNKYVGGNKN